MNRRASQHTTHCSHVYHPVENIHEFVFHDKSSAAVEEYAHLLYQLCVDVRNNKYSRPISMLLNLSHASLPPMRRLHQHLAQRHMENPENGLYIAYVTREERDRRLLQAFNPAEVGLHSNNVARAFFTQDQRAQAIKWLIEHNNASWLNFAGV